MGRESNEGLPSESAVKSARKKEIKPSCPETAAITPPTRLSRQQMTRLRRAHGIRPWPIQNHKMAHDQSAKPAFGLPRPAQKHHPAHRNTQRGSLPDRVIFMRPLLYQPAQPAPDRDKPFACLEVCRAPGIPAGPGARIRGRWPRARPARSGRGLAEPGRGGLPAGCRLGRFGRKRRRSSPDRAEVGGSVEAVAQERGGLRLVLAGAGPGVFTHVGPEVRAIAPGFMKRTTP